MTQCTHRIFVNGARRRCFKRESHVAAHVVKDPDIGNIVWDEVRRWRW